MVSLAKRRTAISVRRRIFSGVTLALFLTIRTKITIHRHDIGGQLLNADFPTIPEEKQKQQRRPSSNENATEEIKAVPTGYDVLDIGASKGGSISFLRGAVGSVLRGSKSLKRFQTRTIGLDIDPEKVDICNSAPGRTCVQGDVLKLQKVSNSVAGTTMWHVLEHMPDCEIAVDIWRKASQLSSSFTSFRGPAFDDATYLKNLGFHRYYEDWSGHTCAFDTNNIIRAIESSPKMSRMALVVVSKPIKNSLSDVTLPSKAARNSHHYDPKIHPPKQTVVFSRTVYEQMRACAVYNPSSLSESNDLYAALCLRDTLLSLRKFQGSVVYCKYAYLVYKVDQYDSCLSDIVKEIDAAIQKAAKEI